MIRTSAALPRPATARALAEAMFPAGDRLSAADPATIVQQVATYVERNAWLRRGLNAGLLWLEARFLATHGHSFSAAKVHDRRQFLNRMAEARAGGHLLRVTSLLFKAAYVLDEERQQQVGSRTHVDVPSQIEHFRWQAQVTHASDLEEDQTLDADVVVIGTGAGGAAAAYELASLGLGVVIIEEGEYFNRSHFNGRLTEVIPKLYRASGATVTMGNAFIPIPVGRNVGGTTTINSGTCMRTPPEVLVRWQQEHRLSGLTQSALSPWFETVEDVLGVSEAEPAHVGEIARVIGDGGNALGFRQMHPLRRNARGCDGQGLCQFGCPTDAKQSTNVSFIPRALDRGAFLFTGFRAEKLLHEGNTAKGLVATGKDAQGRRIRLKIMAPNVVVSMGSFFTPLFLRQNGIKSPHLGKHLTIHPAGAVTAWFPDRNFRNSRTIPQGFGVSDLAREGLMFEGGTIPFAGHGILNNLYGDDFVRMAERYQQTAYFGVMVKDTSEGEVRRGLHRDIPWIRYRMNQADFALFQKGIRILAQMFFAAGAPEVMIPGPGKINTFTSEAQLADFLGGARKPSDFLITAYHPLGTARISQTPAKGVCDAEHRVFGWQGLYVMDGSSVPSSLGANPQVTIMALASRAANLLGKHIQRGACA